MAQQPRKPNPSIVATVAGPVTAGAPAPGPPGLTAPGREMSDSAMLLGRELHVERQEHLAAVSRLRRMMPLAMALWIGFGFVDWVVATFVYPGPLTPFFALRAAGLGPMALVWLRLRQGTPTPRELVTLDVIMTSTSSGLLSVMCLYSGGIASPYAAYVPMVLMGRAAVMPDHWRRGLWTLGVPALMTPLVFVAASFVRPEVATQLADRTALGTMFFFLMLIGGAWLLLTIGGHNVWALRRQVFESRSIGRYKLRRRIGRGGMGEVWVAFHDGLKRDVALKLLRPDEGTDELSIARFEREIMATAELAHPNTIRIYDHGVTEDGIWYYAMELLSGEDLAALVEREGPLPPARAIHIMRQAARALAEAHARGIVHRDIKPENLFVTTLGGERDFVKVLDFGIAKIAGPRDSKLTTTGWVGGTPTYLSPEVAEGKEAHTPADVYGLGGALYWAVTGTAPFDADNPLTMFYQHVHAALEPPSVRLGQAVPADLEAIIQRCLEKAPVERFADASELAEALDSCEDAEKWRPGRGAASTIPSHRAAPWQTDPKTLEVKG